MGSPPQHEKVSDNVAAINDRRDDIPNEPMSRFRLLARRLVGVSRQDIEASEQRTVTQNDSQNPTVDR